MPASVSTARSAESSSRIGFVLFTWISARRVRAGRRPNHSIMPPGPLCGRWPMLRAVFFDRPIAIISSSVQKVPSTSTRSAPLIASNTAGSIAPRPGA